MQLARQDVGEQRERDDRRGCGWALLQERIAAVANARRAVARGERGARFALRQALVDLAACSESMADALPAPTVLR